MFHARQLFRRSASGAGPAPAVTGKSGEPAPPVERHPAMRGLDVSPVHGRHCICGRCAQHQNAA